MPGAGWVTFRGPIEKNGINPFMRVSAARAAAIKPDWRRPMPVLVRIDGHPKAKPWRINMMPMGGGAFYLYLHGDVRRASRREVGDEVRVEARFDAGYRSGPMHPFPRWFRAPLLRNARAWKAWQALVPSRQKEILRYLAALKTPEARARNAARALAVLSGQGGRFMARAW